MKIFTIGDYKIVVEETRTILKWYNERNDTKEQVDNRIFGRELKKYFGISKQSGKSILSNSFYSIQKGERYYSRKNKVDIVI